MIDREKACLTGVTRPQLASPAGSLHQQLELTLTTVFLSEDMYYLYYIYIALCVYYKIYTEETLNGVLRDILSTRFYVHLLMYK